MRSTFRHWIAFCALAALLVVPRPSLACFGDCNDDQTVTIDELVRSVGIALGSEDITACDAVDNNRDGTVAINELIRGVGRALNGCGGGPAGEILFSPQNNELDEYNLASGAVTTAVPNTHANINGQICLLPGGAGSYVGGEDTGQPVVRPGWGIFSADGTFLQKITLPAFDNETVNPDPIGCVVDADGRLFGSEIGAQGGANGHLVVFFPPDYTTSCTLDSGLHTPGMMTSDDAGNIYLTEAGPPGRVQRYAGPFPANAGECATVVPTKTPFIAYTDAVATLGVTRRADGHFFVSQVVGLAGKPSGIREHAADGTFLREIFPAGDWGNPAGMAFDSEGTLYYADLGINDQMQEIDGTGTLRRITFDGTGKPSEPELVRRGLSFPDGLTILPERDEWLTLGGSWRRTYFNPRERAINSDSAPQIINKWRYTTSGMITAQAMVTSVDLPGEGKTQIVIFSSWDGYVYALRSENGSLVWRYLRKPQPGANYPFSGSPTIAWIDGQQRVYVPGGETMYCLDATTGAEVWQFDAGTGCTTCGPTVERNEIESTPAIANGRVFFGMDVNDSDPGKGGVFAIDARDGRMVWYFDMFSGGVCRPLPSDEIRRYDGFNTAEALGLPADFFSTRPGCDHPRLGYSCGNVWSSPALDLRRGLLFTASSNCDTDDDPNTNEVPPPMPPHDEALFALTLDGDPVWTWRPREVDNDDLAFGAVPNLFEATIGGAIREVVGIGNKDGTYYVLDRDGTNQLTNTIEPYWSTNVVPGGPIGGIIGAASVGEGVAVFSTGFGFSISRPQKPGVHALDLTDGHILWEDSSVDTAYAPCNGVPGLALCGSTPRPNINVFERESGTLRKSVMAASVPGGVAASSTVVAGHMFVGAGTGAFNEGSDAEQEARRDTPMSAFCVQGTPGCATNTCNDGNTCTYDYRDRTGTCVSEPGAENLDCKVDGQDGHCAAGVCTVDTP